MLSRFKKSIVLGGQAGFSLIELMVVVAIIGILATVAVPQFTKFQNRAKQSEASTHLSGIFTAETAFAAQWSAFDGYVDSVGYAPSVNIRYNCGVGGAYVPPNNVVPAGNCTAFSSGNCCGSPAGNVACTFNADVGGGSGTAVGTGGATAAAAATSFKAVCDATFVSGNGSADEWTIDQTQIMAQTANGI